MNSLTISGNNTNFLVMSESANFLVAFDREEIELSQRGEAVHVVVAEGVVGLVGVDNEQSRSPEIIRIFVKMSESANFLVAFDREEVELSEERRGCSCSHR